MFVVVGHIGRGVEVVAVVVVVGREGD